MNLNNRLKILVVSEAPFNENGAGASQTLYNLFKSYDNDQVMLFCPRKKIRNEKISAPLDKNVVTFKSELIKILPNKAIFRPFNQVIKYVNKLYLKKVKPSGFDEVLDFNPDIIVVVPISFQVLCISNHFQKYFPGRIVTYFMDDWISKEKGEIKKLARNLLISSTSWLMISEKLTRLIVDNFSLQRKPTFIVHNPVDRSLINYQNVKLCRSGTFRIIYAGSIWPMHFDALLLVARAVKRLKEEGHDVELKLYTSNFFWQKYSAEWKLNDVEYGGWVNSVDLKNKFSEADLLLAVSAFDKKQIYMTQGSVQTKLTDYMASGRPLIGVGPSVSASIDFIKKWDCGFVYEQDDLTGLTNYLLNLMRNRENNQNKAKRAIEIVEKEFETKKVSGLLYGFLNDYKS